MTTSFALVGGSYYLVLQKILRQMLMSLCLTTMKTLITRKGITVYVPKDKYDNYIVQILMTKKEAIGTRTKK